MGRWRWLAIAAIVWQGVAQAAPVLPEPEATTKPWAYWWWMGSAVDRENISALLEAYSAAGLGGVHIIPIYGVKGEESRFIDYLSPQWLDLLGHTVAEAKRLGMGVDMSTGTGWPFGGPNVTEEMSTADLRVEPQTLEKGKPLPRPLPADTRLAMAYYDNGVIAPVSNVAAAPDWVAPANGTLYSVRFEPTGVPVERAAPGGAGLDVNPFSPDALRQYLKRFDRAFDGYNGPLPRAQYHDSFEYPGDSTRQIFPAFADHCGYPLEQHLPELLGQGDPDRVARVRHDYRETVATLLEYFTRTWVRWSHDHGFQTRNQAHGSPGNLLDLYALADIPETEIFGASAFPIPGLRTDPDFVGERPNPLINKVASSAAHVTGKRLVSSESCTWLAEHFRESYSQVKPELDRLFTAGVNHVFYHGMAYSPRDAAWPGWLFYASTNFAPSNPQWPHFGALNGYVARVQSAMQAGDPDNDVLIYFPVHDVWQQTEGSLAPMMSVHAIRWFSTTMGEAADQLWKAGYGFDYISDRQVENLRASEGRLRAPGGDYRVLVVPSCRFMPVETLRAMLALARAGAPVLFLGGLPNDVPGLHDLEARRTELRKLARDAEGPHLRMAGHLPALLADTDARREPLTEAGLQFMRRKLPDGCWYFIANLGERPYDGWTDMGTRAQSAVFVDPMVEGRTGRAAWSHGDAADRCRLQLDPGESILLRTFDGDAPVQQDWAYRNPDPERAVPVDGPWQVTFVEGGPSLPDPVEVPALGSWTAWSLAAADFSGLARYRTAFQLPEGAPTDMLLDLGDVRESARVFLNGREVATLFALPFRVPVSGLRTGENELIVEVANLGANRIAWMDRQGIQWRRFYEINFVNIRYKAFDASTWPPAPSGLLGPVRLVPTKP